jgi:dolichyl-phosphate beta-glucosyltransferase
MSVDGFAFDVELLWLARRAGLRVHEQPVRWRNSRGSSVSLFSDAPRMLWDLVRLRRRLGVPAGSARPPRPEAQAQRSGPR